MKNSVFIFISLVILSQESNSQPSFEHGTAIVTCLTKDSIWIVSDSKRVKMPERIPIVVPKIFNKGPILWAGAGSNFLAIGNDTFDFEKDSKRILAKTKGLKDAAECYKKIAGRKLEKIVRLFYRQGSFRIPKNDSLLSEAAFVGFENSNYKGHFIRIMLSADTTKSILKILHKTEKDYPPDPVVGMGEKKYMDTFYKLPHATVTDKNTRKYLIEIIQYCIDNSPSTVGYPIKGVVITKGGKAQWF